ncbi:hypothetical protein LIER_29563 [Lithospermum erythrorhizon]|uniref:Uncharacterized protein n=1 Tax=Lithospermum erythrorhizon TaxID=34254 RepID=A0AAV3RJM0_LITER
MDDIDIQIAIDDDGEKIGGVVIGEMLDIQNINNDGSTAATAAALDDFHTERNSYGKAPRAKKSIVHSEMVVDELPDGTKYKSTSNGKKYLDVCLQRKLK